MPRTLRTTPRLLRRFMGGSTLFNGTTSTIPTTLTDNAIFQSGFVLHGWIKPMSRGETSGRVFDKSSGTSGDNGFQINIGSSNRLIFQVNGGTSRTSANGAIKYNEWQHILVHVASNAMVSIYVNGVLSGTPGTTGALAGIATDNPLTIGNSSTGTDSTFHGRMAELGIISLAGRGNLTTEEIQNLYSKGILPTGSVNFWPLDEPASPYTDTVGGKTGTGTATTYSPDTPVQQRVVRSDDKASLRFDGVNDNVVSSDTSHLFPTGGWVFARFKLRSLSANQAIVGNALNLNGMSLIYRASGLVLEAGNGSSTKVTSGFKLKKDLWYSALGIFQNGFIYLYLNGQLVSEPVAVTSIGNSARGVTLAKGAGGSFDYANCLIKYACASQGDTALTAQQIRDLHFSNVVPRDGLVGEWLMNEGAGSTVFDTSGNGNHGTITDATWSSNVPSKARKLYGGNLVNNGDLSYVPAVNVPTTTSARWIDGTANGSTNIAYKDLFGFFTVNRRGTATYSAMFDTSVLYKGKPTIKIEVTAQSGGEAAVRKTSNIGTGWSASAVGYIPIKPSTVYKAKIAIKTEGVLDGGANTNVNVSIAQINGAKQYVTQTIPINNLFGTQDFIEYELTFTTNASARFTDFIFEIRDTTGIAWFADIELLEVGAARTLHP